MCNKYKQAFQTTNKQTNNNNYYQTDNRVNNNAHTVRWELTKSHQ